MLKVESLRLEPPKYEPLAETDPMIGARAKLMIIYFATTDRCHGKHDLEINRPGDEFQMLQVECENRMTRSRLTPVAIWLLSGMLTVTLAGCGTASSQDQMIDPLNLIEDYDPATPRHHPTNLSEVDLGEYYITVPIENSFDMLSIRFRVHAVVPKAKLEAITKSVVEKENRVKDQLMTVVQRIDHQELADPSMTWLKAEMIPVLNRELRSEDIRDVVFSDFTSERG